MVKYAQLEKILYSYKTMQAANMNRLLQLQEIDSGVNAISWQEKTGATNKITSVVEDTVIKTFEKRKQLKKKYDTEFRKLKMVENALNSLTVLERQVVEYKYFLGLTWKEISIKTNYGLTSCKNIRAEAMQKMLSVLNCK